MTIKFRRDGRETAPYHSSLSLRIDYRDAGPFAVLSSRYMFHSCFTNMHYISLDSQRKMRYCDMNHILRDAGLSS